MTTWVLLAAGVVPPAFLEAAYRPADRSLAGLLVVAAAAVLTLASTANAADTIKIGLVAAMSGQSAKSGEAIVRGIERRQARIIRPRRWILMSLLRGLLNPVTDAQIERDPKTLESLKKLDARAGEDQPTTA